MTPQCAVVNRCRYCRAPHESGDGHYARCPIVLLCLEPTYWPVIEKPNNSDKRRGKATGKSGDNIGWRKRFKRKAKR